MAELFSLVLAVGPLRFDACLQWSCNDAEPMLLCPPESIDVPDFDDELAEGFGFRS